MCPNICLAFDLINVGQHVDFINSNYANPFIPFQQQCHTVQHHR